jgi:sarcosine oxidase subunit alpha
VKSGSKTRAIKVGAVAFEAPAAPSFEVAAQAGASIRYAPRIGYEVEVDERGRAGEGVWALGECTGRAFHPEAFEADAAMIAEDVVQFLRATS